MDLNKILYTLSPRNYWSDYQIPLKNIIFLAELLIVEYR